MSCEVIEEYLAVAHFSITSRKPNGGAYGYPAILLLFCIVDAFSNYAGYPENSFRVLKDMFPDLGLSNEQAKRLAEWYRHLPAHQAILMPGTVISVDLPGNAIELNAEGEPTHIRLLQFWEAVNAYWPQAKLKDAPSFHPQKAPKSAPVEVYGTVRSEVMSTQGPTAAGAYLSTSTIKKI